MSLGYLEVLASITADGPTLTAAARGSALGSGANAAMGLYTLPPNKLRVGDVLMVQASGRVSFAVTTPGTFRLDLSAGVGGTAFFDTLAVPGNIVVQTTVPWSLEAWGTVRTIGASGTIFWQGLLASTALLKVASVAVGPWAGVITIPYNTAPVVGAGWNMTIAQIIDFNFTQTVSTGSFTLHQYVLSLMTSSGF